MKKTLIFVIIIVVVLFLISFILFSTNKPTPSNAPFNQISPTETTPANMIVIKNFSFEPSSFTVKTGTTVTWINEDSAPHDIKSDIFSSPILQTGDKFQFTFNVKGIFNYYCGIHPAMTGTVIIE